MKIAIIGGGIGGMTLALALHDAGIEDVDIYESASAIKELVENAIDAGARSIDIQAEMGGLSRIIIEDNGRGMSETEAAARIASQVPDEERLRIADVVIDTAGTLDQTLQQVDELWSRLGEHLAARAAGAGRRE